MFEKKKKMEEPREITCAEAQDLVNRGLDDLFQHIMQGFNKEIINRAKLGYTRFSDSFSDDRLMALTNRLETYYKDRGFSVNKIKSCGFMGSWYYSLWISWETEDIKKLREQLYA
jgi:hypothetical protein